MEELNEFADCSGSWSLGRQMFRETSNVSHVNQIQSRVSVASSRNKFALDDSSGELSG